MAKLVIDGVTYDAPELGDMTMGQARVLKRYTNMTLQALARAEDAGSDPDVISALAHLAIQGAEPNRSFASIQEQVENIRFAQLRFEDDGGPVEEPDEDEENPTVSETGSEPSTSGESSTTSSDVPPVTSLPHIGMEPSDTGATSSPNTSTG